MNCCIVQDNRCRRLLVCVLTLFYLAAFLLLPILISLKCDGKLPDTPWLWLWAPGWAVGVLGIYDNIAVCLYNKYIYMRYTRNQDVEEVNDERNRLFSTMTTLLHSLLILLLQVCIFSKLDGVVDWSWRQAFLPWIANDGRTCLCIYTQRSMHIMYI